jgi:septation ring formation regulator EzrA
VSTNNIPTTLPTIEKLIQRIQAAERGQQREIRISIQEARDLTSELSILTSRLGKTVSEIHKTLQEIKESTGSVDVKFDGGGF